jgi:hypothetical protein
MSKLSDKVYEYLKKGDFRSNVHQQGSDILVLSGLSGSNTSGFIIEIIGKDTEKNKLSYLIILTHFPIKIPPNKREKIQYLFNELNKDTWLTYLSIDMGTGDVMCTASNISNSDDAWNENFIDPILFLPLNRLDGLTHYIMELLYSEKTVYEILQKINAIK